MTSTCKLVAVSSLVALMFFTGCSKKTDAPTTDSVATTVATPKLIVVNGQEPQSLLIPANINEIGGGRIIVTLFSGLKYYDAKGNALNDVAKSITTDDRQHYVIKIRDDAVFSDGSPVKAENFTRAWDLAVEKKQMANEFFSQIVGYPNKLTGLKIVDDKTFTVDLVQPVNDFELRLGYSAFYPMHDSAFADLDAYGKFPISNGPYKLASASDWKHNQQMKLVPNDKYNGPRKAKNDGIKFVLYAKLGAAYADLLSNQLDVLDRMPEEALATMKQDLGDRFVNQPSALSYNFVIHSHNVKHFKDDQEGNLRRQAVSMAINRQEIIDVIFNGTRTAATEFTSPVIAGYNPNIPGSEVLKFNPEKAKQLWKQADAISKFDTTFTIAYNADADHRGWVDAVTNQLKNNLGIKAQGEPMPDFKSLRNEVKSRRIKVASRAGWQADYPGAYNFLAPVYTAAAKDGSNDGDYDSPEFDKLIYASASASTEDEGHQLLEQAQQILLHDLPAFPLWYVNTVGGYSKKVSNVVFGWDTVPLYYLITKN